MTTPVVPIRSIAKTPPEAGRIRLGVKAKTKGGKTYPKSIDTFRLTSQYRHPLEQAAELWGGEVRPWEDAWEVITETNSMPIIVPMMEGFDPLGGTPIYELWSAGGCTRRCDGEQVTTPQQTGADTIEMVQSPCICANKGVLECSVKLRLVVGLPDLDFFGFWRLETGSMYAVKENQAMLELIAGLQQHGIHRGVLTLERREIKKPGLTTKKFVVPIVRLAGSMNELQAGATSLGALGPAPARPELSTSPEGASTGDGEPAALQSPDADAGSPPSSSSPAGPQAAEDGESDAPPASGSPTNSEPGGADGEAASPGEEDIVDAEIVEDDEEGFRLQPADAARYRAAFMARTKGLGLDYDTQTKPWLVEKYGGGWSDLTDGQKHSLYHALMVPKGTRQEKEQAGERFKKAVLGEVAA